MKKADLTRRAVYAVRGVHEPCMLLDTVVHSRHAPARGPLSYAPAADRRPKADRSRSRGFDRWEYGFVFAAGEAGELEEADPTALYAAVLNDGRLPQGCRLTIKFVTSLAAILGPHDQVRARENAEAQARATRESAELERYNQVITRLNELLGAHRLHPASPGHGPAPTGVKLTLTQAGLLADAIAVQGADHG